MLSYNIDHLSNEFVSFAPTKTRNIDAHSAANKVGLVIVALGQNYNGADKALIDLDEILISYSYLHA